MIGIITQARSTSSRLPGKVLIKIRDKSILEYHVDRLRESNLEVFVATTVNSTDDPIASLAKNLDARYFRGDEQDVLSRYYQCAKTFGLDTIVRVTSDCPLIDGNVILEGIHLYQRSNNKKTYVSNCVKRTFPRGFDFEIFSFDDLELAYSSASSSFEREHVTPFIRNPHKNVGINIIDLVRETDASRYRVTLDEPDDLLVIQNLIEKFEAHKKSSESIIEILENHPEISMLNAKVLQKHGKS